MDSNNRGIAGVRLFAGMIALFALTVIFIFFDPVITTIQEKMVDILGTTGTPLDLTTKYLNGWHIWVPLFIIAIFIYMVSAGFEPKYQGGVGV